MTRVPAALPSESAPPGLGSLGIFPRQLPGLGSEAPNGMMALDSRGRAWGQPVRLGGAGFRGDRVGKYPPTPVGAPPFLDCPNTGQLEPGKFDF